METHTREQRARHIEKCHRCTTQAPRLHNVLGQRATLQCRIPFPHGHKSAPWRAGAGSRKAHGTHLHGSALSSMVDAHIRGAYHTDATIDELERQQLPSHSTRHCVAASVRGNATLARRGIRAKRLSRVSCNQSYHTRTQVARILCEHFFICRPPSTLSSRPRTPKRFHDSGLTNRHKLMEPLKNIVEK